jgi:hypothetical protein
LANFYDYLKLAENPVASSLAQPVSRRLVIYLLKELIGAAEGCRQFALLARQMLWLNVRSLSAERTAKELTTSC